jgi:hypothetical protein
VKFKVGDRIVPDKNSDARTEGEGVIVEIDRKTKLYKINWDNYGNNYSDFETVNKYYRLMTPLERVMK